jgi:hypothetical protein
MDGISYMKNNDDNNKKEDDETPLKWLLRMSEEEKQLNMTCGILATSSSEEQKEDCDTAKFVKEAARQRFLELLEKTKDLEPEDGLFCAGEIYPGEQVYVLIDYRFVAATTQKVNKKTLTVELKEHAIPGHVKHSRKIPIEKVARGYEKVAIVWELWKGKNGRGAYRIERELYPQYQDSLHVWSQKDSFSFIREDAYGVINPYWKP